MLGALSALGLDYLDERAHNRVVVHLLLCFVVFDACYFAWHRLHHVSPLLYKHIHSVHHEYRAPFCWVTQHEHVLKRPDTYIGSTEPRTDRMWVYDAETKGLKERDVTFVPGLYKIFDEILVNAADHKVRCPDMKKMEMTIASWEGVPPRAVR